MKTSTHHARVVWDADADDRRAHTIELAGQRLAASSSPHFGGDGDRADPEEMLVGALSSCHMLWFLALARIEGVKVTAYEDDAEGLLDGERFTRVVLRPRVSFGSEPAAELIESLHHGAHRRCFIANSVNFAVAVEPRD